VLLPREQSPWNCGYVLGAYAIASLQEGSADLNELQARMTIRLGKKVSTTQAMAAAGWLFLIAKVRQDENGC
jgi:hypothetical protein